MDFLDSAKFQPLQTLIKRSIWRKRNKVQSREAKSKPCRIQRHWLIRLPAELQYMILDLLTTEEIQELRQVIDWPIPYTYWMSRIHPRGMMWELQDDDGCYKEVCDKIDWDFFYPRLEKLLQSEELAGRGRIMTKLQGIKADFFQSLQEQKKLNVR